MKQGTQLTISLPQPCSENWNSMTPAGRGRYCGSCKKMVIDFSAMSDRELVEFLKTNGRRHCGRFSEDQLQRPIAYDQPTSGLPASRWLRATVFAAIAGIAAMPAHILRAQTPVHQQIKLGEVELDTHSHISRGKVMGNGLPLHDTRISIPSLALGTTSDAEGNFELHLAADQSLRGLSIHFQKALYQSASLPLEANQCWIVMELKAVSVGGDTAVEMIEPVYHTAGVPEMILEPTPIKNPPLQRVIRWFKR